MVKKLFLLLLWIPLFATISYDFLQIEATLFPKIVLLDKEHSTKLSHGSILFYILHDPKYHKKSQILATLLQKQKIPNHPIEAKTFTHVPKSIPTAYIIFSDHPAKFYTKLKRHNRLIFCVRSDQIRNCAVSVAIEGRVYPLINPKVIKELKLVFEPILYKVSRYYEN